jgi:hypothetical protein
MYSEDYVRGTTALGSVQKAMASVTSDADLAALARSPEAKIRAAVGESPLTPLTTLLLLSSDEAPTVRAAVARNPRPDIPVQIRETLAEDKSVEVLFGLIKCPALPEHLLSKLARSSVKEISVAAKDQMKVPRPSGGAQPVFTQVGFASS